MIKYFVLLTITVITLSGCLFGISNLIVYKSSAPYTGEPEVLFHSQSGKLPLFQFKFVKKYDHHGIPYPDELETIKTKGAEMGASLLFLDCPGPGLIGSGMCMVYGYK